MSALTKCKIVCDGYWPVNDKKQHLYIYDEDGRDVSKTMGIAEITIHIRPGELITADFVILAPAVEIEATVMGGRVEKP